MPIELGGLRSLLQSALAHINHTRDLHVTVSPVDFDMKAF